MSWCTAPVDTSADDPTRCPQIINLAFDVQLQEERTIRLLHQFSPETRYLRLAPPTGNVALTEHKEEVRSRTCRVGAEMHALSQPPANDLLTEALLFDLFLFCRRRLRR